jgi:hypothetical protein
MNERDRNHDGQFRDKRDDALISTIIEDYSIRDDIPEDILAMELGDYQEKYNTENLSGTVQHLRDTY